MYENDNRGFLPNPYLSDWPSFTWQEKLTKYIVPDPINWRDDPNCNWHDPPYTVNNVSTAHWNDVITANGLKAIDDRLCFNDPIYPPNTSTGNPVNNAQNGSGGVDTAACQYAINPMLEDDNDPNLVDAGHLEHLQESLEDHKVDAPGDRRRPQ